MISMSKLLPQAKAIEASGLLVVSLVIPTVRANARSFKLCKGESARMKCGSNHVGLHAPTLRREKPVKRLRSGNNPAPKPITGVPSQRDPRKGEAPTEEDGRRILYTRHAVYFGDFIAIRLEPHRGIHPRPNSRRERKQRDLDGTTFEIPDDSNHNAVVLT